MTRSAIDQEGSAVLEAVPELRLVRPLPGFEGLSRFVLVALGDATEAGPAVLYELRSLEEAHVRFLTAVPTAFFPDYVVELDEDSCADLGLADEGDALMLVVLTSAPGGGPVTANLLAPVVINARTRSAAQVILTGASWPVRAPLGAGS